MVTWRVAVMTSDLTVINTSRFRRRTSLIVESRTLPESHHMKSTRSVSRTTCSQSCITSRSVTIYFVLLLLLSMTAPPNIKLRVSCLIASVRLPNTWSTSTVLPTSLRHFITAASLIRQARRPRTSGRSTMPTER